MLFQKTVASREKSCKQRVSITELSMLCTLKQNIEETFAHVEMGIARRYRVQKPLSLRIKARRSSMRTDSSTSHTLEVNLYRRSYTSDGH